MSNLSLEFKTPVPAAVGDPRRALAQVLNDAGLVDDVDMRNAQEASAHFGTSLGENLVSSGVITDATLARALAAQNHLQYVDLDDDPPKPAMSRFISAEDAARFGVVPWRKLGKTIFVAAQDPDAFGSYARSSPHHSLQLMPVIAPTAQVRHQITALYGPELAIRAATCVPAGQSCRTMQAKGRTRHRFAAAILLFIAALLVAFPGWVLTGLTLWALLTSGLIVGLRTCAFIAQLCPVKSTKRPAFIHSGPNTRPVTRVSVLVPLLHEEEIANALISRLERLTYPKPLLQIVLVLEEGDTMTRDTIARTNLPPWFDVIEVPNAGDLRTKPRALNYALDFCRGSIIGVWDAEDAPEIDQIDRIVAHFSNASEDVACVQGILDYYNAGTNWISRCFTLEYASWWRVILPGIARMGLVIPLGGTTFFFRRTILERLARWDAHNVTEDADLGVRLARHGYKTELLATVTYEEANFRAWPWIKQRSRWLKGFLITWCVHMRHPIQLLRDVGFGAFLGIQTLFLATVSQFLFAPLLWSFCISLIGVTHPVENTLGPSTFTCLFWFFVFAEILNMSIALKAASGRAHRHLMPWAISLPFYFILGTFAAYKALYEFVATPFYWDKTEHGIHSKDAARMADSCATRP